MKRIFKYILLASLLVLAVSCNMDSTEGLFEEAAKSVKNENYTIYSVIGKIDGDNNAYIIATSDGFSVLSSSGRSTPVGNGIKARYALCATKTTSITDWEVCYYDSTNSKYMLIDQSGKEEEYTASTDETTEGAEEEESSSDSTQTNESTDDTTVSFSDLILQSAYYDMNEDKYAAVFKDSSSKWYIAYGEDTAGKTTFKKVDYTDVSYIGSGTFIGYNSSKDIYYFTTSDTTGKEGSYRIHFGDYNITAGNAVYKTGTTTAIGTVTGKTYSFTNVLKNGDAYYIVPGGSSKVYIVETDGVKDKSCSALSNVEIKAIVKVVDENHINVITASSGAGCINLSDSTVDKGWK